MIKKLNWNIEGTRTSNITVDKEQNKGLILTVGHILTDKKIKKPIGYQDFIKNNNLTEATQEQLLKEFINKNKFDFYIYNILSTDKFYTSTKYNNNILYSDKQTIEFIIVIYFVQNRLFLKGFYNIYDSNKNQVGATQTVFINELQNNCKFILENDIKKPELKGILKQAYEQALNNFTDLKSLSYTERQEKLKEQCDFMQELQNKNDIYISLQTQNIKELKQAYEQEQEKIKQEQLNKTNEQENKQ